jgi:hypothetical protein
MSVNKYAPHLVILPEDDANRQIVNGFILDLSINHQIIQVLPPAKGWKKLLDKFNQKYIPGMRQYNHRRLALVMDFDQDSNRIDHVRDSIPADLLHRTVILGVWSEPEKLKQATAWSYEKIGRNLVCYCPPAADSLWHHKLLSHNIKELNRIGQDLNSFLFNPT